MTREDFYKMLRMQIHGRRAKDFLTLVEDWATNEIANWNADFERENAELPYEEYVEQSIRQLNLDWNFGDGKITRRGAGAVEVVGEEEYLFH